MVRVKICGITRLEDALAAVEAGADALGFNFWPKSKRYVDPRAAGEIIARLPPFVATVGVFVDPTRDEALRAAELSRVGWVQLHGDEPPALCASLPLPVIKALRVRDRASLDALGAYDVAGFLLDADTSGYGGSGQTFDWALAAEAARRAPIVLAGGLKPENVAEAVRQVRPWAVDVASGVERAPGVKDPEKTARFIREAKAVKEKNG
ncbi:MAG TPA: phosphoribosylanthranilate isomerase [Anaeromyxobacteraceae bacterium]|nr:phosphoribosylanthranilate isomerase [Anaeromyxobacteraceae bacterium]